MAIMILTVLAALAPLVLALLEAYATQQRTAAPEKRDDAIDHAFAGTDEVAVARHLHELRNRLRRLENDSSAQ